MYKSEILEKLKNKPSYIKINQYDPSFFEARGKIAESEKPKPKGSWFSIPLRTISRGLDYLATFNPLEAAESIGGMVKESLASAKKFVKSPFELHKLVKYNNEVKELNKAKRQGKISEQAYNSRMNVIGAEAKKLSQEYDPKTAASDALSASLLIPGGGVAKGITEEGLNFLARGGLKGITRQTIKKGLTSSIPKATGVLGRGFQMATLERPMSTPIGKGIIQASKKLAEGKAIADITPKITGKEVKPIKLMKEGKAREAVKFAGMMTTPIPFVGEAFQKISQGKKYVATASEYQAAEPAFKEYFGKAMDKVSVFKNKDARAGAEAYILGVMKEKAIPINKKNIVKFLDDIYSPKIQDLPMISNSVKRLLKANGVEKVEDVSKMTNDMLEGILKNKSDVKALRESIEEMGKTSFTGMPFKTPEEQLKALAVFGHKGIHSGTWRGTPAELRSEIAKSYDEIAKGIKGPEIGAAKTKTPKTKTPKFITPKDLIQKGKKAEQEYREWVRKQPEALERIKQFKEQAKTITNKKAAAKFLKDKKHEFDTEFSKKFAERIKGAIPKTKAITPYKKPPPKQYAFTMKNKTKWGGWTSKTAKELGFDNLYSQGVRELPKGDASFLEGRKAELGRIINKFKEGKVGKLLTPQNSREIYSKIRAKLDKSIFEAFGKDASKAEKIIHETLGEPLVKAWGKKVVPIFKPSERELGIKAWKDVVAKVTGKSLDSEEVLKLAKKLDKDARAAFVTSMKEAGVPTYIVDKMRAASGFYNWAYYNLYTLPRFQLRARFWWQQIPEVYEWGTARASKFKAGSLIKKALGKQISLKRTLNKKSELSETQRIIEGTMLGQTEDITTSGVRGMLFHKKNEANAYGMATILEADKALNSMPVVRNYLKKHGLKSAEEIPYLRKTFYAPLADDAENLGKIIKKYGFNGAKAHLADPTKTVLKQGREAAVFDNAIREALKIAKPNAYKEAIPLFLYNPDRSALEKSLHGWPMFPLSYALKVADRGGGYILEGKAIRPKVFASIINATQDIHENEKIKEMEKKYWNLFNATEDWLPVDPSYDFSTGFLPPFSKMLWRWAENPEYYLDEKRGVERSMKVLWPAYREAKGWKQVYDNIAHLHKKVRDGDTMTEEEARKIIEGFRYKEPTKIKKVKLPKLPAKPKEKSKVKDYRTTQEKRFSEKKARRKKLLELKPKEKKEEKKFTPKITVPKTVKPKPLITRPRYSKP